MLLFPEQSDHEEMGNRNISKQRPPCRGLQGHVAIIKSMDSI